MTTYQFTKNQHTVPRTWLQHFTTGSSSKIHVFDTQKNVYDGSENIKKVSYIENFYDFNQEINEHFINNGVFQEPADEQFVETKLLARKVENNLGTVLPQILQKLNHHKTNILEKEQKSAFSVHIAIQMLRTSVMREFLIKCLKKINELGTKEQREEYQLDVEKMKELHHYGVLTNLELITHYAQDYLSKSWVFLKRGSGSMPFFISDNPIVFDRFGEGYNYCVPLSSDYLLFLVDPKYKVTIFNKPVFPQTKPYKVENLQDYENSVVEVDDKIISKLNIRQVEQCDHQVFASENSFAWLGGITINKTGISKINHPDFKEEFFTNFIKNLLEK
ncbi:Protein of unknown function [Mesobacillus persicus]|uniref:DUF4238 domain-containing protein n=1 Tax=Mesobacillus persicus TaxID=930146 RepID=A0A1H7Z2L9_9BACI|nr:DUF4238 domain-containing protein [Mesobacillus persicus]SEM52842.1 Protein of unknown function [Mesobacillus persicus]